MPIDFGTAIIAFAVIAGVLACISFVGTGKIYRELGRTGLALDEPDLRQGPAPGTTAYDAEMKAELRQMLGAKSARREARGEEPLDVEAELGRLLEPPAFGDPELRAEVESLVTASNARRARRGEPPLDVDDEVERRLRELGG